MLYWLEYDDLMEKLPIRSCKMRLLIGIRRNGEHICVTVYMAMHHPVTNISKAIKILNTTFIITNVLVYLS